MALGFCVLVAIPLPGSAAFVRWTATGHIYAPTPEDLADPSFSTVEIPEFLSPYAERGDTVEILVDIALDALPAPGLFEVYPTIAHIGRIGSFLLTPANSTAEFVVRRSTIAGFGSIQANIRGLGEAIPGWRIDQFAFALSSFAFDGPGIPTAVQPYQEHALDIDWSRIESELEYPEFLYSFVFDGVTATVIPAPAAVWLCGSALLMLGGRHCRVRRAAASEV